MRRGFTLIEMSIVLVIIGLIIGGVVTGRSLIHAAELRSITSDVERFTAAINTFVGKYNALPGDMATATTYWGTQIPNCTSPSYGDQGLLTCNGNGDGRIDDSSADWEGWGGGEFEYFWQHLSNAGLIPGHYYGNSPGTLVQGYGLVTVGLQIPMAKFDSKAGFLFFWLGDNGNYNATDPFFSISNSYRHVFLFGRQSATAAGNWQDLPSNPVIAAEDALNIDTKTDDGRPGSGRVMGEQNGNGFTPNCTTSTNPVVATYDTTRQGPVCALVFLTGI